MLQHVAACCSALQRVLDALRYSLNESRHIITSEYVMSHLNESHAFQNSATRCNAPHDVTPTHEPTHPLTPELTHVAQHAATRCNMLQHAATRCNTMQHVATCCNTLQHAATRSNTLQHAATHHTCGLAHTSDDSSLPTLFPTVAGRSRNRPSAASSTCDFCKLQCVGVCCSVISELQ